jgi:hypothetical protein
MHKTGKRRLSTGLQCSVNSSNILESVMKNTYKYLLLQSNSSGRCPHATPSHGFVGLNI